MLSKELLSEILNVHVSISPIIVRNNIDYLVSNNQSNIHEIKSQHKSINVHELAHKAKIWAYKLDEWDISSGIANNEGYAEVHGRYATSEFNPIEVFTGTTEPEVILLASQWILEKSYKDKKNG